MSISSEKSKTSLATSVIPSGSRGLYEKSAALIIAVGFCGIIFFSLGDYGVTWDEAVYFQAGQSYFSWLKEPSLGNIDSYWAINHEHPPVMKLLGGISEYVFHEKLNLLNRVSSFRLPILIFVFLSNYFLFLFTAELFNVKIAFITTVTFFFLPRVFFHSHLGAMDYPITSFWIMVIYFFRKGMQDSKWIMVASILLGLALLTKINAFLLYIPLLFYWVLTHAGKFQEIIHPNHRVSFRQILSMLGKFSPLLIIPPILLIDLWPWLWRDTCSRIAEYFFFHKGHYLIYVYYLGVQNDMPPWHYPWVMTAVTVPLITLVPFLVGVIHILFFPSKMKVWLLLNALLPLLVISLPSIPKYDGVRLFLPAFPFMAVIAGMGIHQMGLWAQKIRFQKVFYLVYIALFLLTIHSSIIKVHPYQSSYFNEMVGGTEGALKKGFEVEYWGNAYIGVLPWLNEHSNHTFWIYMADLAPQVLSAFELYKKDGLLKEKVQFGGKKHSDYLILLIRQGFFSEEMWRYYRHSEPVFSVKLSNAPLVNVYDLKEFRAKK
jgi:4-amino-4-deoxy-L-arabinose transferase-like glycosyltransferase